MNISAMNLGAPNMCEEVRSLIALGRTARMTCISSVVHHVLSGEEMGHRNGEALLFSHTSFISPEQHHLLDLALTPSITHNSPSL